MRTVEDMKADSLENTFDLEPFMVLRVLVEYDQKYKFWVARCLQTGSVVTADEAKNAEEMMTELLTDEISYAIVHNNFKNLLSSPAPLEVWKRWTDSAAKNGSHKVKLEITAKELRLDEPNRPEVKVARATA
jgi:hypothetical protein